MKKRSQPLPYKIEYWAVESVEEQHGERALMRAFTTRSLLRFGLFVGALMILLIPSAALENLRCQTSGARFSIWRFLAGLLPVLLGLIAVLGVSASFVQKVYDTRDWISALKHVWLLLFGRAPLSVFDWLNWKLKEMFPGMKEMLPSLIIASYPTVIVRDGQIEEKYENTPAARHGGPASVVVFNDSAVVLERFGRFRRVAGPGAVFLRRFERIREVLDLRPQERVTDVQALTKDGIPVKTKMRVHFQLRRLHQQEPKPGALHPYYRWAWTKASQCHSVLINKRQGWDRENHWPERVMGNVGSTMRALIADYTFDSLLKPDNPDEDPRQELVSTFQEKLDNSALNFGANVLNVQMEALKPASEKVEKEFVARWRARKKNEALEKQAEGKAEAIRELGHARAYAQLEMVLALTKAFQEVTQRNGASMTAEFVALRFIEALRQMWAQSRGIAMPSEAIHTLDYLQQLVQGDYAPLESEISDE